MPSGPSTQAKVSQRPRGAVDRLWPLYGAIVLLAAVLPHLQSLGFDFVWDDKAMIGPELQIREPGDLVRLWNTPFDTLVRDPIPHNTYFRPLSILSLALDRTVYGSNPGGFHLTNLVAYALACILLWLFAWELSGRAGLAALGTAVFALHPTHPESVDFIAGRTDVICGLFVFASLWAAARWGPRLRNDWLKLWPAAALLFLGL